MNANIFRAPPAAGARSVHDNFIKHILASIISLEHQYSVLGSEIIPEECKV